MPRVLLVLLVLGTLPLPTAAAADERLTQAAARANLPLVRQLLAARADVNAPDADGTTPLHWAVWADHPEIVDELLRAGASAASPNTFGVTPIYTAAERGNARIIRRLLAAGAKADGVDRSGETVLMAAVRSGSLDAVTALVDAGADVNAKDAPLGHTVLMMAVRSDNAPIVKLLLARGATLDARTRVGAKPAARPPGAGGGSHGVGIVRSGVPPQGEQLPTPGGMTPLM
ncbi:MAG: ankyrin repeat domain-containing protein, partial [Vicinamibacterales bacterium]